MAGTDKPSGTNQGNNPGGNQGTNQGTKQGSNPGSNQSGNQGTRQDTRQDTDQGSNRGANQGTNQGTNQPGNQGGSKSASSQSDTSGRGFASMDPTKQREIASEGGRAAHAAGTAHEFTSQEAREAGKMSHKNDGNQQSGQGQGNLSGQQNKNK